MILEAETTRRNQNETSKSVLTGRQCRAPVGFLGECEGPRSEHSGFCLLLVHLPLVEFELLALEDVAVSAADLARAGGDGGEDSATLELLSDFGVDDAALLRGFGLGLDVTGGLLLGAHLVGFFDLLRVQLDVVLAEVPEAEGVRIDRNNGVLDNRLRADELVVRRVVDDVEDLALLGDGLGAPAEVAAVETQRTCSCRLCSGRA